MIISVNRLMVLFSCAVMLFAMAAGIDQSLADERFHQSKQKSDHHKQKADHRRDNAGHRDHRRVRPGPYVVHRGPVRGVPAHRWHRYRDVIVVRPYGPLYPGYGYYFYDSDAYPWLAFTAITLKVLDNMNEEQQRAHEAAQIKAAASPVGEKIIWNEAGASGSVTTVRDGTSTSGRYCREFQHEVTIGGKTERAYGTACRQPDGSWEVISTGER
jgi:hypothetical protein